MNMDAITSSYFSPSSQEETKGLPTSVWQAEVALRLSFLRKVYGILSAQLLLSVVIGGICVAVPPVTAFVHNNVVIHLLLLCFTLVTLAILMANRFNAPKNFYLLIIFTVFESLLLGSTVTYYETDLVIKALGITAVVFVVLTLYTMQSKYDFSTWGASLFTFLLVLLLGGIVQLFFWSPVLEFVLSVAGTLVFSGFIIFDTHLIMHALSPEDYILAAINLYMDFINLFLQILKILQYFRRE